MLNKSKLIVAVVIASALGLVGLGSYQRHINLPETVADYAAKSVKITLDNQRSGGTGVILKSSPGGTEILTNKHVCDLIQLGGIVIDDKNKTYPISSFQPYTPHDLCLVHISADLGVQTVVAKREPKLYSQDTVTGHPALLPSVITRGHFSHVETIQLMIGTKPCDGSEQDDEAIMCVFMGVKPLIKDFSAQATSALIMPGSSGSGVFNDQGELSGLVFAGSQGLSYSFIVPWTFINDFLTNRANYKVQVPDPNKKRESLFSTYFKMQEFCSEHIYNKTCKSFINFELYNHD